MIKPTTISSQGRGTGLGPLYELTQDVIMYVDEIERLLNDPHLDDQIRDERLKEIQEELASSQNDVETKLTSIRNYIKAMEIECDGIDREVERLRERKRTRQNQIKGLKDYAIFELRRLKDRKFKTDLFTLSLQLGPPKVVIDDEKSIPSIRTMPDIWERQEPKLLKNKIRDLLKADENSVTGCHLEREEGLRIR